MSFQNLFIHPVSGKTNHLLVLVLALVPALMLFPFPASVFSNGIDPPLAWVFNFLVQGKLSLGKHIVFPHGPLAFLMYPLPMGFNLWIAVCFHLAARVFLAYSLLKLATRKPILYLVFAWLTAFVLLSFNDLLLTMVQIVILCYLNFFERRNISWLYPALIITALAVFIKAFVGIVSLLVTFSFACIMIYRAIVGLESRYRLLLLLIVPFVIVLIWLGLYGDLHGILKFLKGMSELAADNSAAVAVYPVNNWWYIGLGIACGAVLLFLNRKNRALIRYALLIGPALFAIWKYGMAREDYQHASVMFIFILFIVLIYSIIIDGNRILTVIFSAVIVTLFYLVLQTSYYFEPFHFKPQGVLTLANNALNNRYFADTCQQSSLKAISRNTLDKSILDLIGDETADIYPWDYSYIAANHLNWQPRPVIQSYASYTRELDQLNARHFESENAPMFVIWELRKITHDIHGGSLESIDGRYLLNDEPDALKSLISNYDLVARQGGLFPALVFRKKAEAVESKSQVIGQVRATWDTWISVPGKMEGMLQASVNIERNIYGSLKSFFYKDEAVYVYYLLTNGDIRMYRIVPKNAAYGLWINPLIMNPENGKKEPLVKKIMFRSSNTSMMQNYIDIKWNQVIFSGTDSLGVDRTEIKNPVYSFFGITKDADQTEILSSFNNLEETARFWSSPEVKQISVNGRTHSMLLLPNEYSVSFEYPLDSLSHADDSAELIIRTGLWAKAKPGVKAVYVISVEKDGKPFIWKAVDINEFLHDEQRMNFVANYSVLNHELLALKGLILKVYAWNTGTGTILLDDFSVRIEKR